MKILSVAIPSYNSEAYLENCVESILAAGDGIEILIVNDGSTDRTGEIADDYARRYPTRIRAIHQQNAGHGGAVNTGIQHAGGFYFKVVDSDDWVNPETLKDAVDILQTLYKQRDYVDMFLANFVYDKVGVTEKKIMHYNGVIPSGRIISWSDMKHFRPGKYILMHSVIFRLDVLRQSKLELPTHTFYVDNLFVYQPLPYVERIYYMDACIYHYFIGREEQSVNEKNMIARIDQQLTVNRLMMENVRLLSIDDKKLKQYLLHYLTIVTTVSSVLLIKSGTKEALVKKQALWRYIREYDSTLYLKMRLGLFGSLLHLPGMTGRKVTLFVYKQAQRRVGFN